MLKKLLLLISLPLLGFLAWLGFAFATESPPDFFPLDDKNGNYKITKACPAGQGNQKDNPNAGNLYCVEYEGDDENTFFEGNFMRITVGKSKIDLKPFLDKEVRIDKGRFDSSSEQCIITECVHIGGPFVVLNLDKVSLR